MSHVTPLSVSCPVIDDTNFQQYVTDWRDPQTNTPILRGHVPRPYDEVPEGELPFASAFPFPKIPRNEWDSRIEELDKTASSLYHIWKQSGMRPLNQNGTNYCHDDQTEVLTEKGWKYWSDYNWSDYLATVSPVTQRLEFQPCLEKHIYEYNGELIHSTNRCVDFGVTPDHRMLIRKWNESRRILANDYTFQTAKNLGWYTGLMPAPKPQIGTYIKSLKIDGDRTYTGNDFVALLSLIISDGYAGSTENTKNWVSFALLSNQISKEFYDYVSILAKRNGFHESPSKKGIWIRYDAKMFANWLKENIYTNAPYRSQTKRIPQIIKEMSSSQIRHFLNCYGDKSIDCEQYYSTSKQCINDLQELMLRIGKRGSIWQSDVTGKKAVLENGQIITSRSIMYFLHERKDEDKKLCLDRKKHIEQDFYKGNVYCASVPNGTLVTRRNGSLLISGNCWTNGVVTAIQLTRLVNNAPFIEYSSASVAAPIKGYRNQGGWGGEALHYIVENGILPVEYWPANAIKRQYDTPESREIRKNHRIFEFYELKRRDFDQLMTAVLLRFPVAVGYNWWSHEVCAIRPVKLSPARYGIGILNSWGSSYGENGFAVLSESKATPDDAVCPAAFVPITA